MYYIIDNKSDFNNNDTLIARINIDGKNKHE